MSRLVLVFTALLLTTSLADAQMRFGDRFKKKRKAADDEVSQPLIGGVKADTERVETGPELGVRFGVAIPVGDLAQDVPLKDVVSTAAPLWLDVGSRFTPNWSLGGYFGYGFASYSNDACEVVDCSASTIDLGLALQYHFLPRGPADPWLSLGVGYEWLNVSASAPDLELSQTAHGFRFAMAQAGLDFVLRKRQVPFGGVGPFLSASLAQYGQVSVDCSGAACAGVPGDASIQGKTLHVWLWFGVRATFVM